MIVGYQKTEAAELFETLLDSLSYNGIGGKRSAGMGRFEYMEDKVPDDLKTNIQKESKKYILLSAALPEDQEMNEIIEKASYNLLKRSGFVMSETYAEQQMRKRDLYVFAAGSCFGKNVYRKTDRRKRRWKTSGISLRKGIFPGGRYMNRSLKVYNLDLKVKGPVFVGSGAEIQKKEYLF